MADGLGERVHFRNSAFGDHRIVKLNISRHDVGNQLSGVGREFRKPTFRASEGSARNAVCALTIARTATAMVFGSRWMKSSVVATPAKVKKRTPSGSSPRRTSIRTFPTP